MPTILSGHAGSLCACPPCTRTGARRSPAMVAGALTSTRARARPASALPAAPARNWGLDVFAGQRCSGRRWVIVTVQDPLVGKAAIEEATNARFRILERLYNRLLAGEDVPADEVDRLMRELRT